MSRLLLASAWAAAALAQTFTNPVLFQDLADADIFRVNDTFYYSASNMHFSPGAPLLRSYDLVNWEYFTHTVPVLDFDPRSTYDLDGSNAYNDGIYASFINYHEGLDTWFWGGCITGDWKTYIYTSPSAEGPWEQKSAINSCYYDSGLFIDDDGTMYVVFLTGWNTYSVYIAELTADGLGEVERRVVWENNFPDEIGYAEGFKLYKREGYYYILAVRPQTGNIILRSDNLWGPYEWKWLVNDAGKLLPGFTDPKQGGLVELDDGRWYHLTFIDGYPGGRIPAVAPVDWSEDGWPTVRLIDGKWSANEYEYPLPPHPVKTIVGTDTFSEVGPQFEWNHNPDNTAWSITDGGLELKTATVTDDFFAAKNTLSHRILGPSSTVTIELDYSQLADGDRAGLVLFDYNAGWIGVTRQGDSFRVLMVNSITMSNEGGWHTTNLGTEVESAEISGGTILLRTTAGLTPPEDVGTFEYSTDGETYHRLGDNVRLINNQVFFMGWRYGIFNYATAALGGSVTVRSWTLDGELNNDP